VKKGVVLARTPLSHLNAILPPKPTPTTKAHLHQATDISELPSIPLLQTGQGHYRWNFSTFHRATDSPPPENCPHLIQPKPFLCCITKFLPTVLHPTTSIHLIPSWCRRGLTSPSGLLSGTLLLKQGKNATVESPYQKASVGCSSWTKQL
jgi:hypothetical protein